MNEKPATIEEKIIYATIDCINQYGISGATNRKIAQASTCTTTKAAAPLHPLNRPSKMTGMTAARNMRWLRPEAKSAPIPPGRAVGCLPAGRSSQRAVLAAIGIAASIRFVGSAWTAAIFSKTASSSPIPPNDPSRGSFIISSRRCGLEG